MSPCKGLPNHDHHSPTDDNQHGCADHHRSTTIKHYHAQHIHHEPDPDDDYPGADYDIIVLDNDGPPCDDDNCLGDDHNKYYVFDQHDLNDLINDLY